MSYRRAKALDTLVLQLDTLFPKRSKISDGWIGDARHSKNKSDHNPNSKGVVTAVDITFDDNPADGAGVNCHHLADCLAKSKDKRIKYIIWNSRITVPGTIQKGKPQWRKYTGTNPHKHHLHISVSGDAKLYDSTDAWDLADLNVCAPDAKPYRPTYTVKPGDTVSAIIKRFGLKMVEFYQLNNFTGDNFDPDNIRPGDVFYTER